MHDSIPAPFAACPVIRVTGAPQPLHRRPRLLHCTADLPHKGIFPHTWPALENHKIVCILQIHNLSSACFVVGADQIHGLLQGVLGDGAHLHGIVAAFLNRHRGRTEQTFVKNADLFALLDRRAFLFSGETLGDLDEKLTVPKSEFYLPSVVSRLINDKTKQVCVLVAEDKWYGVTYKEDKQVVVDALADLISKGAYANL